MRPTKKWLAPAITSTSVAFHSLGRLDHRRGLAELVVLTEHQLLRARVGGDRAEVGREAQRRRDREPARQALVVGRERHVGAERPAREQERFVAARARSRHGVERRLHVEELAAAVVVRARAPLDAPEVEPQTR